MEHQIHIAEIEAGNAGASVKEWSAGCSCGWSCHHQRARDPRKLFVMVNAHAPDATLDVSCKCVKEFEKHLK